MDWIEIPEDKTQYQGVAVLLGASSWSAHNFLQRLSRPDQPIIWVDLSARDQSDPVSQGNRLAQAVERAFGSPLFGLGMPFSYGLNVLQKHQGLLGSFAIGVYGAEYALEMVEALLAMPKLSQPLVLCFEQPSKQACLKNAWVIDLRPAIKAEPVAVSEEEQAIERQGIYNVLVVQRKWVEAFEWAVLYFPAQAEQVLEKAANLMWAQGSSERLYRLLGQLPKTPENSLAILRWQFTALLELGREGEMLEDVRAVLNEQPAPDLRALYAIALYRLNDSEGALREAVKAVDMEQNTLTQYVLGYILPTRDPMEAVTVLRKAVRNAELEDSLYESAQSALTLTHTFFQLGQYKEAMEWAGWGLRLYDQRGLQNQQIKIELFNEWAFMRILLGDTAGLEAQLDAHIEYLEKSTVRSFTEITLRTTLADLLLVEGRSYEAFVIYRKVWNSVQRRQHYNFLSDSYVRVLLENDEFDEAFAISRKAVDLTEDLPDVFNRRSRLSLAMCESLVNPETGIEMLKNILDELSKSKFLYIQFYLRAQLYLARALFAVGETKEAEVYVSQISETLKLTGQESLRFMAGPAHAFQEVFSRLEETQYPLELKFMGQHEVRLNGAPVQMRRRFMEILAVLALNPEGLSSEELMLAVYGDKGTIETLRSDLSRLREVIPITPKPYRIQVPVKADFVDLQRLISRGKVREALRLYHGALFPESTAEGIEEERNYLEEALRTAVLNSQDPEALMGLAEKLKGDPEVWEAAAKCLSKNDPRRVVAKARAESVTAQWN
ncbi:MAG: hypothetical protein SFU83_00825 [Meiothermus sp.]|nr:hypothetical protein [Meiothermus sp.]